MSEAMQSALRTAITVSLILLAIGLVAYFGARQASRPPSNKVQISYPQDMRKIVEESYSDQPTRGIAHDWVDCIENDVPRAPAEAQRIECFSWTQQGVTSQIIALRDGERLVPVIESVLAGGGTGGESDAGIILDLAGGTGGQPFHTDEAITPEFIERFRRAHGGELPFVLMKDSSYYRLLVRGFTIASVGYWGTGLRTLNEPGEIELGGRDVRAAFDHYTAARGRAPALLTMSLGNHVALAGLGAETIEQAQVLSLVPLIDGLQRHLKRAFKQRDEQLAKGKKSGSWSSFNVFKRGGDGDVLFDFSRFQGIHDHLPRYVGSADYAWTNIALEGRCSQMVLARKDPRTWDYLQRTKDWPDFMTVFDGGHDIFSDAPEDTRALFADFGDCLLSKATSG